MRTYYLHGRDQDEAREWIEAISLEMKPGSRQKPIRADSGSGGDSSPSPSKKEKTGISFTRLKNSLTRRKGNKEKGDSIDKAAIEQVRESAYVIFTRKIVLSALGIQRSRESSASNHSPQGPIAAASSDQRSETQASICCTQ